jgi:hypothetical protein
LTTQDQKLTRENHDHKGPGSFIRNCCKNTHPQVRVCPRCSRPLCSSQTTTPSTRPPTPTQGCRYEPEAGTKETPERVPLHCCKKVLLPQDPTVRQTQPTQTTPRHVPDTTTPTQRGHSTAVLTPGHNR